MSPETSLSPDPFDETNLSLLGKTQDYLKATLAAQNPNTILSAAWDEFYRIYNDLIRRFVRARLIPEAEVEDCVQEVWAAVAKHLVYFKRAEDRPGLRSWLFTVVRTKAADVLKRRRGYQRLDATLDDDKYSVGKPNIEVWMRLLLETILDEVQNDETELNCRILRMKLFENYRTSEIARQLNLPATAVRYRYLRMLRKLRFRAETYTGLKMKESREN